MDFANIDTVKHHKGYTLVEIICCMIVISVIASMAVPAYSSIISKQKVLTSLSAFQHSVMLARSESIKSSEYVAICPSLDGKTCHQQGYDFSYGWISFKNLDRDYPVVRDDNEELVQSILLQNSDFSLVSNRKTFTFRPINKRNTNGTLMFCPHKNTNNKQQYQAVIISYTGRPRLDNSPKANHIEICTS